MAMEVLSEIFYSLCKRPIFVCDLTNSHYKEDFPSAVGLVCRQWRTAFLTYPPIWASLELSDIFTKPETSEYYAKEINRRLALYLERSGGYPLKLDIVLWTDYNKSFTMMALKMLSACSHRWQTAKFDLSYHWQVYSILPCKGKLPILERLELEIEGVFVRKQAQKIFKVAPRLTHANVGPWAKFYGWTLPYTQLTELSLLLTRGSVFRVLKLLPMLHNVKELRLLLDEELDCEDRLTRFAPTPLNQLRVLEVPHPAILSWFETPSLCDLYLVDYQEGNDEPLDARGQISSIIQRSGCQIRKLSFSSTRQVYVGTLNDVEQLGIYSLLRTLPSIDISSLPKLRFLTIICCIDEDTESLVNFIIAALKSARVPPRNECSPCTPISCLEHVTVELCYSDQQLKIPKRLLEMADKWPLVVFRTQHYKVNPFMSQP